jgi:glucose-1-phosphate thymidylyltransferase
LVVRRGEERRHTDVNAKILDERAGRRVEGEVKDSRIEGRVEVGRGARVVNSVVRGPSIIGEADGEER